MSDLSGVIGAYQGNDFNQQYALTFRVSYKLEAREQGYKNCEVTNTVRSE